MLGKVKRWMVRRVASEMPAEEQCFRGSADGPLKLKHSQFSRQRPVEITRGGDENPPRCFGATRVKARRVASRCAEAPTPLCENGAIDPWESVVDRNRR